MEANNKISKSKEKSKKLINKKTKIKSSKKSPVKKKNAKKKSKSKSKSKNKGNKSGKKKKKKNKTSMVVAEDKKEIISNNNDTEIQKKDTKKLEVIIPKKTFIETKVGTPHLDLTKHLKVKIKETQNNINNLSDLKIRYTNQLKNIIQKLTIVLNDFQESPEQKERIRLLYLILNIVKKNNEECINRNALLKKEYTTLFNRNNYDPIKRINEFRTKIDISKNENLDMQSQIKELKNNNLKKRHQLRLFALNQKNDFNIVNLSNELHSSNNEKQKVLNIFKDKKKVIYNYIIKFKNLYNDYEENKKQNINQNLFNSNKIEKDINILKCDLSGDEDEIIKKIMNRKMMIFTEVLFPSNLSKNNTLKNKEIKKIQRSGSAQNIKTIKSPFFENNNKISSLKKKILLINQNEIPNIMEMKHFNSNKNIVDKNNEKNISQNITNSDVNDKSYYEINNKKEYYNNIIKKLDYSIREIENMYKRKIVQAQEEFNQNLNKFKNLKKENKLIKNEIDNFHKILSITKSPKSAIEEKTSISIENKQSIFFNTELIGNVGNYKGEEQKK